MPDTKPNDNREFVLNLAPTGMVPRPADTPHVPTTRKQIVAEVLQCRELGATSVHLHARDENDDPTNDKDTYARIIEEIRVHDPDVVIAVSCSGRNDPEFEGRSKVLDLVGDAKPDMASLTLSSLNFPKSASVNAPDTIRRLAERMAERGIKPEIEIFDLGMVNYVHYLIGKGALEPPFYFNIMLGNIATAQADVLHLGVILKELPANAVWSVGGIGDAQLPMNAVALALGGGVRTGLEDNIWFDGGRTQLATNGDMVKRIVELARLQGKAPMLPATMRRRLSLA